MSTRQKNRPPVFLSADANIGLNTNFAGISGGAQYAQVSGHIKTFKIPYTEKILEVYGEGNLLGVGLDLGFSIKEKSLRIGATPLLAGGTIIFRIVDGPN